MKVDTDNIASIPGHCAVCGVRLTWDGAGRRPVTCSNAHRQELYRRRQEARKGRLQAV